MALWFHSSQLCHQLILLAGKKERGAEFCVWISLCGQAKGKVSVL